MISARTTPLIVALLLSVTASYAAAQTSAPAGPQKAPVTPVPPITDEDRRAAFPAVDGHTVHDRAIHYFVLVDQLEWVGRDAPRALNLDSKGWIGGDLNRFWYRLESEIENRRIGELRADLLYGLSIGRWWDLVGGIRQDVRPGPAQTWAAIGIQGLAPYWFEVEATAYFDKSGRTQFRFETEYELLLTNRLVLQPLIELELYGQAIPERGIGAGLSRAEYGLRLRYEIKREFAPYFGLTWDKKYGATADFAGTDGESPGAARLAVGLRTWF